MADLPTDSPPSPQDENAMASLMDEHVETPNDNEAVDVPDEKPEEEKTEETPSEEPAETSEEKPEEEKTETPEEPATEEDDFYKEIDKIQVRKETGPRTKGVIKILKEKAKAEHKLAKELLAELESERQKYESTKPLTPELEKKLQELEAFKSSIDVESDPEFNRQYVDTIKQYEEGAIGLLRSWRLPDSAAQYIREHGGVLRFRTSQERMPATFKNEDGSVMTHEQWWESKVANNMTKAQQEEMGDLLAGLRQVYREKDYAIQEARQNRDRFMEQKQQEQVKQAEDWSKRVEAHAAKVLPQYGELAKLKEVPANATPEQKSAIEKHNANYKKAEAIAQKYLTEVTPEHMVEAAIATAYSAIARDELKSEHEGRTKAEARIKALEQELQDIREAGKVSKRGASATVTKVEAKPKQTKDDALAMEELMKAQDNQ